MKKLIDERGRLFGKISVIDVVVILVAAATIFAAYAKFNVVGGPTVTINTVPVTYKVIIRSVRNTSAALLREGDTLFSDNGFNMGKITAVDVTGATTTAPKADGTYVKVTIENRYDVELTVEAQCSVSAGRYYANRSFELAENSEQKCHTKYVDVTLTIIELFRPN
ncbi:MAG: DUF4330 domain-containing protein [Oscillospiraceae bacterium]|nr:DUF4330 domain-containing protein [Oscillospiraceae bacterium]